MVLKPGPDRTVPLEKPRTAHFCGSFSLKNRSMGKNRDPCKPRLDLTVLRTVIKPLFTVPYFPLNLNLKKNKKIKKIKNKKKKRKTKEKETQLLGVYHVFINTAIAISRETQHVFMFLLLLSSEYITQLPLFKNSSLGRIRL